MPLPIWREGEVEEWPESYRRKYTASEGGHEAVGMCRLQDEDWRRIKSYYYGMISLIDKNIGRLVEALEGMGQMQDTIIIFTADHGENLGDHHLLFKGTTYDCVTAMPFILSWPGYVPMDEVRDLLACSVDIVPTILDLIGVPPPEPSPLQGASLLPALDPEGHCVRDALLIENAGLRRSVRTRDALLTWHGPDARGELYDIVHDPDCLWNLWDRPEAATLQCELLHLLIQLMAENVDPLPVREGPW
jgi:arylsulfatase A-like enzyme